MSNEDQAAKPDQNGSDEASSKFKRWYEENKTSISERRKRIYQADPELRAEIRAKQREYRQKHPPESRAGAPRYKEVNGRSVQVFRIGEAAALVGRDEQTLRIWEERGVIPRVTVPGVHRNYTVTQVNLMKELVEVIDKHRYERETLQVETQSKSDEIYQKWDN
jgi:hypothetical protein